MRIWRETNKLVLASNDDSVMRKAKAVSSTSISYHKVMPGQNLSTIADKYNVEVQDLKVWNNLKGSSIVPGQRLKIYHHAESKHVDKPYEGLMVSPFIAGLKLNFKCCFLFMAIKRIVTLAPYI